MTPEQRSALRKKKFSWRRGKRATPEEKAERQKKAAAAWYAKNKVKRAAYQRKRRAEKNLISE